MTNPASSMPPGGSLWRRLGIIAATALIAALVAYLIIRGWKYV